MPTHDENSLRQSIRGILLGDDGLEIVSEGTVYVRSLEGAQFAAGWKGSNGIENEMLFNSDDLDEAIDFFLRERRDRNHGTP